MIYYKLGDKNDHVKDIQKALQLYPDGVFGKKTEEKVKEFQKNHRLKETGEVDEITYKIIIPRSEIDYKTICCDTTLKYHGLDIPDELKPQVDRLLVLFGEHLNDHFKLAHFLAQCDHESQHFTHMRENLNYSAKGLCTTFKSHFPTMEKALKYERQPEKIANYVYANKFGNGNEASGDGWRFRGGGALGTTFKSQYQELSDFINKQSNTTDVDLVKNPELIATEYSLIAAAFFFTENNIWKSCKTVTLADVKKVTKIINPAGLGLEDRYNLTKLYSNLIV